MTGSASTLADAPMKETTAFAKRSTDTMKKATGFWSACSGLWSGDYSCPASISPCVTFSGMKRLDAACERGVSPRQEDGVPQKSPKPEIGPDVLHA